MSIFPYEIGVTPRNRSFIGGWAMVMRVWTRTRDEILVVLLIAASILGGGCGPGYAQTSDHAFAGKTISLIIGFPPGTGNDITRAYCPTPRQAYSG